MTNHQERPGGKEGIWAIVLLAVCCIGGTHTARQRGQGVAAVGAARASTWVLVGTQRATWSLMRSQLPEPR